MARTVIMVNSITYAYKARDFLYTHGIKAYIQRVPSNLRMNGCGYGLHIVNGNETETAISLLNGIGIVVKNVLNLD